MRTLRTITLALLGALYAGSAAAQATPPTDTAAPPACSGEYARCALWIDRGRILQGQPGETVARPRLFSPAPLTRIVHGDSASAPSP